MVSMDFPEISSKSLVDSQQRNTQKSQDQNRCVVFFQGEEATAKAGGPAKAGAVGADVKTGIMKWDVFSTSISDGCLSMEYTEVKSFLWLLPSLKRLEDDPFFFLLGRLGLFRAKC